MGDMTKNKKIELTQDQKMHLLAALMEGKVMTPQLLRFICQGEEEAKPRLDGARSKEQPSLAPSDLRKIREDLTSQKSKPGKSESKPMRP